MTKLEYEKLLEEAKPFIDTSLVASNGRDHVYASDYFVGVEEVIDDGDYRPMAIIRNIRKETRLEPLDDFLERFRSFRMERP